MRGRDKQYVMSTSDGMRVVSPLWVPSIEFLAASCHFGWGTAVVLFFSLLWSPWAAVPGFIAFAAVKEFLIDPWMEQDDIVWDGIIDCAWYAAGIALGFLAWLALTCWFV